MAELRDGFFCHRDGKSPEQQIQRLLAGEHNPPFDDLFLTTNKPASNRTHRLPTLPSIPNFRLLLICERQSSATGHNLHSIFSKD